MKLDSNHSLILALAVLGVSLGACGDDSGGDEGAGTGTTGTSTGAMTTMTTMTPTDDGPGDDTTTTGDDDDDDDSSTGLPGTTGDDDDDDDDDSTSTGEGMSVTISGVVSDFANATPVENVDVCVYEEDGIPCATTDAEGMYTLMGVPVAEGAIEFTGNGRFPSLFWGEGPDMDQTLNYNSLSTAAAGFLALALGEEIEDTQGHLALAVADGEGTLLSEVTFTMTPSSGVVGYLTMDGIDPMLTETTEVGFAGWINVDPGEVEITATHPTLTCVPGPGALLGATPDALRIDITAGYLGSTYPFICE